MSVRKSSIWLGEEIIIMIFNPNNFKLLFYGAPSAL
jgi:hypothetical protein